MTTSSSYHEQLWPPISPWLLQEDFYLGMEGSEAAEEKGECVGSWEPQPSHTQ